MTFRNLETRIDRLEANAPVDPGDRIDPSTLTDDQLAMLERAPRLANANIAYDEMSDADLRVLAAVSNYRSCPA